MADWKEKGYVPDSDSDEDSQDCRVTDAVTTNNGDNAHDDQDVQKEVGGEVCGADEDSESLLGGCLSSHVHRDSPYLPELQGKDRKEDDSIRSGAAQELQTATASDLFIDAGSPGEAASVEPLPRKDMSDVSRVSSPLSEAPSSLPDLTDLLPAFSRETIHDEYAVVSDELTCGAPLSEVSAEYPRLSHDIKNLQVIHRSGRTLRHRNAIQLHPYVIEKEKYNQTWRSRGLRPLHILQEEAARAREQEEDSQNFELSDQEHVARSPFHRKTGLPSSESFSKEDIPGRILDDEFPDVDTLLQTTSTDVARRSYKRRKLNSKSRTPRAASSPQRTLSRSTNIIRSDEHDSLLEMPSTPLLPSESQSKHDTSDFEEPRFRLPPGITSPRLPSHTTSSDPSNRLPRDAAHVTEKDPHLGSTELDSHQASYSASSSDEEEVNIQLKSVQRKIKGVLPASWLKLDLNANTRSPRRLSNRAPKNAPDSLPQEFREKRGVARPIFNSRTKDSEVTLVRPELYELSDNDISDLDAPNLSPGVENQGNGPFASRAGEAVEDDSIDAMLPPVKRTRTQAARPRSHQKHLRDFGIRRQCCMLGLGKSLTTQRQTSSTKKIRKDRSKPINRPSRLSVLDMPRRQANEHTFPPSFMKVAMRTARSRHDQGRHSPSQKYLQLATREENGDLNETMDKWREGTLVPTDMSEAHQRQPLRPRSANNAVRLNSGSSPTNPKQTKISIRASQLVSKKQRSQPKNHNQPSLQQLIRKRVRQPRMLADPSQQPSNLFGRGNTGIQGRRPFGLLAHDDSRPAVLESSQSRKNEQRLQRAFKDGLANFNHPDHSRRVSKPVLERFLQADHPVAALDGESIIANAENPHPSIQKQSSVRKQRRRKRNPRKTDLSIVGSWSLRSPPTSEIIRLEDDHSYSYVDRQVNRIEGLGSFGTRYSTKFEATQLPPGLRFHQDTYLGSGDFAKSLMFQDSCKLDSPRGATSLFSNRKKYRWGVWSEMVATEIGEVFDGILGQDQKFPDSTIDTNQSDSINTLRMVVMYFSQHLSFADAFGRISFLRKCQLLLSALWSRISKSMNANHGRDVIDKMHAGDRTRIATLSLVLTAQVCQVAKDCIVSSEVKDEFHAILEDSARKTLTITRRGFEEIEVWWAGMSRERHAGRLIHIDNPTVESLVITYHIIQRAKIRSLDPLESVIPSASAEDMVDFASREQIWQRCFSLLPLFEFNEWGALDACRRFKEPVNGWNIVKRLVGTVLEMYMRNLLGQTSSFNEYCRSLFGRCLNLINEWGWYECDSLIGLLFDFFAQNSLGHLRNEECHGSPHFLENLSGNPALDAEPEDRCFHLLLKIIGSGLKHMQDLYPSKKISGLVWRLMPNHGRSHPKEQPIRQEDLDALRNHHDLLSTLYWAAPLGFRPSLNAIKTLVDLEHSHREACHISIRTWFNLVNFQLSTDEPSESTLPFTQWHSDFLLHMLQQHDRARSEAEDQVRSAQCVRDLRVSIGVLESTIAQNQQQVEGMLGEALVYLELAIAAARTREAAGLLMSSTLARFLDGPERLANGVVLKALNVLLAYAGRCSKKVQQQSGHIGNDDSQDYGDWSAFNADDILNDGLIEKASAPLMQMSGPLRVLLSNCFGADTAPQENLLSKLVDTWVAVGWILVDDGVKSYDDYLGLFGGDAWETLRDTDQTRKFAPYLFSSFIETDAQVFRSSRYPILACWLGSLVQCESSLKFQHKLTTALLNANLGEPLLSNLPFWMDVSTARFHITAVDFSERRLSLISSVLANMRTSVESAFLENRRHADQIRQEYKDLLRHTMMTMKHNYTELIQDSRTKASYVDFVHRVVEYLQEQTSHICPVDRFFTEGGIFPSPSYDPNYVVGHLKSYGLRLSDAKTPKQLAVFLQSVTERAINDGQQGKLVEQLQGAMSGSARQGSAQFQLREFVTTVIVPAYLRIAFENSVGWILAAPFLKACQKIFAEVHLGLDWSNVDAVSNVTTAITEFLNAMRTAVIPLIDRNALLMNPNVLTTLTSCFSSITVVLPTLDYVLRMRPRRAESSAFSHIAFFKNFSTFVHAKMVSVESTERIAVDMERLPSTSKDARYIEVFDFTLRELRHKLQNNWTRSGDDYFITHGSSRRQLRVESGQLHEEQDSLRLALHAFGTRLSNLPALGGWPEWCEIARKGQEAKRDEPFMF